MKTIYKYAISYREEQENDMPTGATLLTVQMQSGWPYLWAQVDTEMPLVKRRLFLALTGGGVPEHGVYIGSFVDDRMGFVGHVYDLGEAQP